GLLWRLVRAMGQSRAGVAPPALGKVREEQRSWRNHCNRRRGAIRGQEETPGQDASQIRPTSPTRFSQISRSPDDPISRSTYALGFAFSLTCPPSSSTEYSTVLQPYSLRSCSVFWWTNFLNEARLAEFFSPAFCRASDKALKRASTFAGSVSTSDQAMVKCLSTA